MSSTSFPPDALILITGANGHVGTHLISQLLALPSPPAIRASVRSPSSAAPLQAAFAPAIASGHLSFTYIPDITLEGVFDTALRGVTHVAHVASPIVLAPEDLERDLLQPAIRGTTSLLRSAQRVASIQAVVVTSSFAAVFDPYKGFVSDYTYSAKDWSPLTYEQAAAREAVNGIDPRYQGFIAYLGSKKQSEAQAWELYESAKKDGVAWRFSTVLPTYIGGPCCVPPKGGDGADGYSFSQKLLLSYAKPSTDQKVTNDFPFWIDVRDVARAHIEALRNPAASDRRWILACQKALASDIARSAQKQFPKLRSDVAQEDTEATESFNLNVEDSLTELGLGSWIPLDEMVRDTIAPVLG